MIEREEILIAAYQHLDPEELRDALVAFVNHLGLRLVRVTNDEWPVGHPDRVRFVLEKAE
jgi:hypothetical protein